MTHGTEVETDPHIDVEAPAGIGVRARLPLTALAGLSSVQRGLTGIIPGSILILWRTLALSALVAIVGVALVVVGLLGAARGLRRRRLVLAGRSALEAVVGAGLVVISSLASGLVVASLAIAGWLSLERSDVRGA